MQIAKVARAVVSERQLEEVMVDFWDNHFTVFAGKGPERYFIAAYEREAIRPHALGKFRDLLGAVAKSPAMLFYLDNWQSAVEEGRPRTEDRGSSIRGRRRTRNRAISGAPRAARNRPRGLNENYARELLELHTLGVDGGYTQKDIIEVARAFTGWTLEQPRRSGGFVFRPAMHDAGEKTVLGQSLKAGRGMEDGEQVLDIVAATSDRLPDPSHQARPPLVSDDPPATLVDRAAETFTRTGGDIREVVRTIVTSQEFFAPRAYRAKVKSPFELVVSALRAMNATPDMTPRSAQVVARLGQPLFRHQAPNGWPERATRGSTPAPSSIASTSGWRWPAARFRAPVPSAGRATPISPLRRERRRSTAWSPRFLGGEACVDTRTILQAGRQSFVEGLRAARGAPADY